MVKCAVYTTTEVAKILKISLNLVYRLISQGQLKSVRAGRGHRITKENLDAFLKNE